MRSGFVIIGAGLPNGQVGLTALQNVTGVQFHEEYDVPDEVVQWGGGPVARYQQRTNSWAVRVEVTTDGRATHSVADECYAQAWTRLLDLWVPPDFTDQTRSQVVTHFTMNDMQESPAPAKLNIDMSGFHPIGRMAP